MSMGPWLLTAALLEPSSTPTATRPMVSIGPMTRIGEVASGSSEIENADLRAAVATGLTRGSVDTELLEGNCQERECWLTMARGQGIHGVLFPVAEYEGPDVTISLEVVAIDTGDTIAQLQGECELCGKTELQRMTADLAATLSPRLHRLETTTAFVVLRGSPVGARIEVDGQDVGTLPWEGQLLAGEHTFIIAHEGHVPQRRIIVANAGIREHLDVTLQPDEPPPPSVVSPVAAPGSSEQRSRLVWLGIGGTLAGAGVATLGLGIGLFAYDGRPHRGTCVAMGMDANGRCALQHETTNAAVISTVIGGTALVVGASLLFHTVVRERRRESVRAELRPALGGIGVRF